MRWVTLLQTRPRSPESVLGVCRLGGTGRPAARTSTAPASCPTSGRRRRPRWRPRGCGPARRRPGPDAPPHGADSCCALQPAAGNLLMQRRWDNRHRQRRVMRAPIAQHLAAVWRVSLFRGSAFTRTEAFDICGIVVGLSQHRACRCLTTNSTLCSAATQKSPTRWIIGSTIVEQQDAVFVILLGDGLVNALDPSA